MKYMKFIASGSDCTVKNVRMVEYKHHPVQLSLPVLNGNEKLQKIAAAAVESYRQNAVDLFTDCPSRERAGGLCDSFFTGRVEKLLTGQSLIERSFLENFLHEESYAFLPEGMLPMCYPSDHDDGNFIPNGRCGWWLSWRNIWRVLGTACSLTHLKIKCTVYSSILKALRTAMDYWKTWSSGFFWNGPEPMTLHRM